MRFSRFSAARYSTFQPPKNRGSAHRVEKMAFSARLKAHLAQHAVSDKSWWWTRKERIQQQDRHPVMLFRVEPCRFWQKTAWFREPEAPFASLCLTAFSGLLFRSCARMFLTHSLFWPPEHPMAASSSFTGCCLRKNHFFWLLPDHFA